MKNGGFDVDEIGFSFYPSSGGVTGDPFDFFKNEVLSVRAALNKPVFVAEYGYPAKLMTVGPYINWNYVVPGYPLTETGQANLLYDLVYWGKKNGLSGIRPWAPDLFLPAWEPMALFTPVNATTAHSRTGLDSIQNALNAP